MCNRFAISWGTVFSDASGGVSENCPEWVSGDQVLINVVYWGFEVELVEDARAKDSP